MFTYKFVGLDKSDAETAYYYGSLPAKPEIGHIIQIESSKNRYAVVGIEGEGLKGKGGYANQKELAWADIGGKPVPTLRLRKLPKGKKPEVSEMRAQGTAFDPDELKKYSQQNRKRRLSCKKKTS